MRSTPKHSAPERPAAQDVPSAPAAPVTPPSGLTVAVDDMLRRQILARIRTLVADADEAEDLTQETLIHVLRALPRFRGESSLKTWALRIAGNVVVDGRRRAARRPAERAGTPPEGGLDDVKATDRPGPEDDLEQAVSAACLRGALGTLPESYRQVFELHDLAGLENAEIAELLGIPLSTVKIRLHRARRRLRSACEAGCEVYRSPRGDVACCARDKRSG